jgi:hypothetical protein
MTASLDTPIGEVFEKSPDGGWTPAIRCDLRAGQHAFQQSVERFRQWAEKQPRPKLGLNNGWYTVTPQMAEQMLICNRRNRKLRWADVLRYGTQMANKRWKKTGEPIIITVNDDVEDAGHRLFACYFSGCSFDSYIVADVPHDDYLFAYIDNGVSRNGEDTLEIAGVNGMSKHLQSVIKKFAIRYDEDALVFSGRLPVMPINNVDILDYAQANPTLGETAHLVRDLYPAAIKRLDDTSVASFLAWKINQAYGLGVLEDFMQLLTQADLPLTHPVAILQQRLDQHEAAKLAAPSSAKARQKLTDVKILALSMRAFNFWRTNTVVKRLDPRMDDSFPVIEVTGTAQAAE